MKSTHSILGIVTVNEKGQVVIPAEARATIGVQAGDKLVVMIHPSNEGVLMVKPDGMESFALQMLEQLHDARDTMLEDHGRGE